MKILLATYWEHPSAGGISTYVCQLKAGLEKLGHRVDIMGKQPGTDDYIVNQHPMIKKETAKTAVSTKVDRFFNVHFPRVHSAIGAAEISRYSFELAAAYADLGQYDVIHTQDVISSRALSRVKPARVPLIATIHGCLTHEHFISKKAGLLWHYYAAQEYYGATSADVTIVPTEWLKHLLAKQFNVPSACMTVVPYGMDVDAFLCKMDLPTDIVLPSDKQIIICPARLNPVKGHLTLMNALAKLKTKRTDWICLLVGDGPLRKLLERRVRLLGLNGQVIFLGNRQDVPSLLKRAHIFVLPSTQDNQPFAVLEAQVAGKAIVTTDAGGIPEMVTHGQTGLISTAGRSDSLYENLLRVLDNRLLCRQLGENCKHWGMKQWNIKHSLNRVLAIYDQVLNE